MAINWKTADQAGAYIHRSGRFVKKEIKAGRLRGAVVGGRREVITCDEWCDDWVRERAQPVELPYRPSAFPRSKAGR